MTIPGTLPARVFAVVSAVSLVFAFALASLFPTSLSLGQFIALIDHDALAGAQGFARRALPEWVWTWLAMPLLVRPAWLLPTSIGLVAGGAALTVRSRQSAPRPRRRRG